MLQTYGTHETFISHSAPTARVIIPFDKRSNSLQLSRHSPRLEVPLDDVPSARGRKQAGAVCGKHHRSHSRETFALNADKIQYRREFRKTTPVFLSHSVIIIISIGIGGGGAGDGVSLLRYVHRRNWKKQSNKSLSANSLTVSLSRFSNGARCGKTHLSQRVGDGAAL